MGYTHYWTLKRQMTELEFSRFTNEVKILIELFEPKYHTKICGPHGDPRTDPEIDSKILAINGCNYSQVEGEIDDSFETFSIHRSDTGFNCCKTGQRPYDTLICAILMTLKSHLGNDVEIKSDGFMIDDDWQRAMALYGTAHKLDFESSTTIALFQKLCGEHIWLPPHKLNSYIGRVVHSYTIY